MSNHPFHIYRSSAGSGKTFTLVRTYLSLLLKSQSDSHFKQVLAVTFTNKAAEEMKNRVLVALEKLSNLSDEKLMQNYVEYTGLEQEEIKEKSAKLLTTILHNYGDFNILTIDKFIHRIIRSFSKELGLNSSFDVESDTSTFLQQSIDSLLDQLGRKGSEEITAFLEDYYESMLMEGEKTDVEKSLMGFKKLFFDEESKADVEHLQQYDLSWFKEAQTALRKKLQSRLDDLKKEIEAIASEMNKVNLGQGDFKGADNSGWNAFVFKTINNTGNVLDLPNSGKKETLIGQLHKSAYYNKGDTDAFTSIQVPLENHMGKSLLILEEIEALQYMLREFHVYSLIGAISKRVQEIKGANNLVFLSEFNQLITSIVINEPAPFIYERIGTRFTNYLVDEFQDTSKLQWQNLIPLFFNSLGEGNENLIVGDDKQAIYRWRGGNVEQFIDLPKVKGDFTYLNEVNNVFSSSADPNTLNDNYRSSRAIIDFNNKLFSEVGRIFPMQLIQEVYEEKKVVQFPKSDKKGYVKLEIIKDENGKCFKVDDYSEIALDRLMAQIYECLEDGFDYGDMAVLIRSKKEGFKVIERLKLLHIPFVSSDSVTLISSAEVLFIVHVLSLISEEESMVMYAKVLEYLAEEDNFTTLYDRYRNASVSNSSYTDSFKLKDLLNDFTKGFNASYFSQLNLYSKVSYIIDQFNLSIYNPYIDSFLGMVLNFEQQNGSNESAFIDYFDSNADKVNVNLGQQNRIQIMTIHKSKGLEFPIVFMPFCNWANTNNNAEYNWVHNDFVHDLNLPNYTVRLSKNLSPALSGNLYEQESEATTLDNLNLYYVAFTRPIHRLYALFSPVKDVTKTIAELIEGLGMDQNDSVYVLGERENKVEKSKDKVEKVKGADLVSWTDKLSINVEQEALDRLIFADEMILSDRQIGIKVHHILSKVNHKDQIDEAQSMLVHDNDLEEPQIVTIKAIIDRVFEIDRYVNKLSEAIEVISEQDIIDETGKVYRPDKILELEDEIIVVDFKIGQPNKKYEDQIKEYIHLIEELYQKEVKGWLLFAGETHAEIIEVGK